MIESMLSGFRNKKDCGPSVQKRLDDLDLDMTLPLSIGAAKLMLREIRTKIKVIRSDSFSYREKDVLTDGHVLVG
jgi:hypothetical protein